MPDRLRRLRSSALHNRILLCASSIHLRPTEWVQILAVVVDESSLAIEFRILNHLTIPGGFARVASPKMMSDCHMLRMNVCDASRQARRHAETRKRVDIYKIASMACARARNGCRTDCLIWYPRRFVTQDAETRKRVDIYKSVGYCNVNNSKLSGLINGTFA